MWNANVTIQVANGSKFTAAVSGCVFKLGFLNVLQHEDTADEHNCQLSIWCFEKHARLHAVTAAFGSIWQHLAAYGSIWQHMAAYGSIWQHLEFSSFWNTTCNEHYICTVVILFYICSTLQTNMARTKQTASKSCGPKGPLKVVHRATLEKLAKLRSINALKIGPESDTSDSETVREIRGGRLGKISFVWGSVLFIWTKQQIT
jgi:hypothetical protein